jgi:hypothetical protein
MKHKCMMNKIGLIQLIPFMLCLRKNEGRSCHTSFPELDFEGIDPLVAAYHQALSEDSPSQCKRDRGSVLAHERPFGLALKENYRYSSRKWPSHICPQVLLCLITDNTVYQTPFEGERVTF